MAIIENIYKMHLFNVVRRKPTSTIKEKQIHCMKSTVQEKNMEINSRPLSLITPKNAHPIISHTERV